MATKKEHKTMQWVPCPKCQKRLHIDAGHCPSCGYPLRERKTFAIIGLIVNVFLPGIGTIIGGDTRIGLIQFFLYLIGIPLIFFFFVGVPLIFVAWIWGIISSVQQLARED